MVRVGIDIDGNIALRANMRAILGVSPGDRVWLEPDADAPLLHLSARISGIDGLVAHAEHVAQTGAGETLREVGERLGLELASLPGKHQVIVTPNLALVLGFFSRLDSAAAARLVNAILHLEHNPRLGYRRPGSLRGARSLKVAGEGSGTHRVLYIPLPDSRICAFLLLGGHENVDTTADSAWNALRAEGFVVPGEVPGRPDAPRPLVLGNGGTPDWYTLSDDDRTPVHVDDSVDVRHEQHQHPGWLVETTSIEGKGRVTTVFMFRDIRISPDGPPILWHTQVLTEADGHPMDGSGRGYATWHDAKAGHREVVEQLHTHPWISRDQVLARMRELAESGDPEAAHREVIRLLMLHLNDPELTDAVGALPR